MPAAGGFRLGRVGVISEDGDGADSHDHDEAREEDDEKESAPIKAGGVRHTAPYS
jgi:hypothetical protein